MDSDPDPGGPKTCGSATLSRTKYPQDSTESATVLLRSFNNLWKKHLAGAEEISDHGHAPHERTLDDVQRTGVEDDILARLLCVLNHKLVDSWYIKKLN